VEIRACDDFGQPVRIAMRSVKPFWDEPNRNLLQEGGPTKRDAIWRDGRLFVATRQDAYKITFQDDTGATKEATIVHGNCQDAFSLHVTSGKPSGAGIIKGTLSGCEINGNWWIRAMPLAGHQNDELPLDAYVEVRTGRFRFEPVPQSGVFLLFIGRGTSVLKTVVAERGAEVGRINMSGKCK